MQTLKAKVSMVLFPRPGMNSNKGWVKLLVRVKGMNDFAATGMIKDNEKNISLLKKTITLTGDWDKDPKFRGNFKCTSIDVIAADTTPDILVNICQVSKAAAAEIDARYGDNITDVLNNKSYLLLDIKGITTKKLEKLIHNWRTYQCLSGLNELLLPLTVSDNLKGRIARHFGSDAVDKITVDPYIIIAEPGLTFEKVDAFALSLGVPVISQRRAKAAMLWAFTVKAQSCGNTAVTPDMLIEACIGKEETFVGGERVRKIEGIAPEINVASYKTALKSLVETEQVVEFDDGYFSANQYYDAENQILNSIRSRIPAKEKKNTPLLDTLEVDDYIRNKSKEMRLEFSEEQIQAIKIAASGEYTYAVCGYAGTGKSTIAKALLDMYIEVALKTRKPLPRILCVALSGVAADRIRQTSGFPASTIHSSLGWIPGEDDEPGSFRHNRFNPLEYDIILLDEASMVDSPLFRDLLDAIAPTTRFIMLGDDAQIAPIGPADVYRDLLYSKLISVVLLDVVFRTGEGSVLSFFAADIRKGIVPANYKGEFNDFCFDEAVSVKAIIEKILALAANAKNWIADPIRDFQVLTPMMQYDLGANDLNPRLQAILNPPNSSLPSMLCDTVRYQTEDKVVHLRNEEMTFMSSEAFSARGSDGGVGADVEEKMKVCNGFIGIVCHVSEGGHSLCVRYPTGNGDIVVAYNRSQVFQMIGLAYCMTIHKYQGSEAKWCIIPIHSLQKRMLNNRLLYTAITRAKLRCQLVGQSAMFEMACKTKGKALRTTVLQRLVGVHELVKIVEPPVVDSFRGWRMEAV